MAARAGPVVPAIFGRYDPLIRHPHYSALLPKQEKGRGEEEKSGRFTAAL